MATVRTVEAKPANSGGMTLDELREFVAECDKAGTPGITKPKAHVTWGGRVKSLMTTGQEG
jgi:hypothetical protein